MKLKTLTLSVFLACATFLTLGFGCKTNLEPGGAYAPTNELGQVIHSDTELALADASYKLAYETSLAVFKFEKDNRVAIWNISPNVKHALDKARVQVQEIDKRWATARKAYRQSPTPEGISGLREILLEINRLLPIIQQQIAPVESIPSTN